MSAGLQRESECAAEMNPRCTGPEKKEKVIHFQEFLSNAGPFQTIYKALKQS